MDLKKANIMTMKHENGLKSGFQKVDKKTMKILLNSQPRMDLGELTRKAPPRNKGFP
jgi:hypothetical protein